MAEKFNNKYRITTVRLNNWDYGWNASYFVTICTHNRECYFGNILNGKMEFSEIGKLAEKYWLEIPHHFPFVKLGAFVVMPNHVHGIITVDKSNVKTQNLAIETQNIKMQANKFGPQSKNLASIIRGYKIGVTLNARMIDADFAWQKRYYDHIIRDNNSYNKIIEYIIQNPLQWVEVEFNG